MARKKPKIPGPPPQGGKKAPDPQPDEFKGRRPVWLLARMDLDGPFGWRGATQGDLERVRSKLAAFETMTWREVLAAGCHEVEAGRLSKPARDRLLALNLDDQDILVSLRVTGAERVWGYWSAEAPAAFSLLWWDPRHAVNPVEKRHT